MLTKTILAVTAASTLPCLGLAADFEAVAQLQPSRYRETSATGAVIAPSPTQPPSLTVPMPDANSPSALKFQQGGIGVSQSLSPQWKLSGLIGADQAVNAIEPAAGDLQPKVTLGLNYTF